MQRLKLFATGFLYIFLGAVNVYQIANEKYVGALTVGFSLAFLWTFNVRTIALSSGRMDRLTYAVAAALATVAGIFVARLIYQYI